MAGMHIVGIGGGGIYGFVAKTYQDGTSVKVGDTINVSLTVAGVDTAGHNVSKTVHDTLKVVDQQFAPLTTESVWGSIDKKGLGDDPSGTINLHWRRTSGERGKIQLENPTLYFVMPNTVSQIKNVSWGASKDAQGNSVPTLTSITYEKSKDGKNTVAIMHFSGALIDQALNNFVPLYFSTVNKDNVVNQDSEGFLYWTADNVNADGLTKIDPSRLDSQNKAAHLPADLTQEQLNKIYLHSPYWGTINMATGMYSTSATKTATMPWQIQTIMDYHDDGQADVGVNLVNDTSNALHNVVAIINLPKATNNSSLTANLTGNTVELIDPNTDRKLTADVKVLYSMKAADLSSNDLSAFVTADQVTDWSKVQAVAVTLQSFSGMSSRQVQIPVVVKDLVANAGKTGIIETRVSADELKPIIVSKDAENVAKLVVGGQATIQAQLHYQDAQGKDHYLPLADRTRAYDILEHHVLNASDFTPSTTELAQVPGYELSTAAPTVVSGQAVLGQPVSAQADGSLLQFELVPSVQKVLISYVDQAGHVVAQRNVIGKTGETVDLPNFLPDGWMIYRGQNVPTKLTFGVHNNNRDFVVTHVLAFVSADADIRPGDRIAGTVGKTYPAGVSADSLNKTVTRTIRVTSPSGVTKTVVQMVHFMRNAVVDAVTGQVTYLGWSETGSHLFAGYVPAPVDGYRVDAVKSLAVTPDSQDSTVDVAYIAVAKPITVNYKTADGKVVATVTDVKVDSAGNIQLIAPAGYVLSTNVDKVKVRDVMNNVYDVLVRPDSHVVTANDSNLPAAVSENDLRKTVTRTILITMPNGKVRTIKQKVTFVRTANVDSKGNLLGYNAWQAIGRSQFNSVFIPKRVGYTLKITDAGSGQLLDKIAKTVVTPDMTSDTIRVNYVKA